MKFPIKFLKIIASIFVIIIFLEIATKFFAGDSTLLYVLRTIVVGGGWIIGLSLIWKDREKPKTSSDSFNSNDDISPQGKLGFVIWILGLLIIAYICDRMDKISGELRDWLEFIVSIGIFLYFFALGPIIDWSRRILEKNK